MDYFKLQADVIKNMQPYKKKRYLCGTYEIYDKKYKVIFIDRLCGVLVPEDLIYIDVEKCFEFLKIKIAHIIRDGGDKDVTTEGLIRPVPDKKTKAQVFNDGDQEIWIDTKYLKLFDLSNAHYKASSDNAILYIYEDETLTGMIMALRQQ